MLQDLYSDLNSVTVHIPLGQSLGEAMGQIRAWLDKEKVQTAACKTNVDADGYVLALGFRSTIEADRFRAQFEGRPGVSATA